MTFQLRSEVNGISYTSLIKYALEMANEDRTIWEISFEIGSGESIRLVRANGVNGVDKSEFLLSQMSEGE